MPQYFIRTLTGKTIAVELPDDVYPTTALEVKRMILVKEGIPIAQQRLIVAGKEWRNNEPLRNLMHPLDRDHQRRLPVYPDIRPHLVLRLQAAHDDLCGILENGNADGQLAFVWMVHYYENGNSPFITESHQFYASDSLDAALETYKARLTTSSPGRKPYLAYVAIKKQDLNKAVKAEAEGKYKHAQPQVPQMSCYTVQEEAPVKFETLMTTGYAGGRYQTQLHPNQAFRYCLPDFQLANSTLTERLASSVQSAAQETIRFVAVRDQLVEAIVDAVEDTSRDAAKAQLNLAVTAIQRAKPALPRVPNQGVTLERMVLSLICDRGGLFDRTKYTLDDYVNEMERILLDQIRQIESGAELGGELRQEEPPAEVLETRIIYFMTKLSEVASLPMTPTDTVLSFKAKMGAMLAIPVPNQVVCALGVELEDHWTMADIIKQVGPLENIPALYVDVKANRANKVQQTEVKQHTNQTEEQLSRMTWLDLSKAISVDMRSAIGTETKGERSIPVSDYWTQCNQNARLQILQKPLVRPFISGITADQMLELQRQTLGIIPEDVIPAAQQQPTPVVARPVAPPATAAMKAPAEKPSKAQIFMAAQTQYSALNDAQKRIIINATRETRSMFGMSDERDDMIEYLSNISDEARKELFNSVNPEPARPSQVGYFAAPAAVASASAQSQLSPKEAAVKVKYDQLSPQAQAQLELSTRGARDGYGYGHSPEQIVKYLSLLSPPVVDGELARAEQQAAAAPQAKQGRR